MSYAALIHLFGRIGCLSFGGPAAQIALMQKELVEDHPHLSRDDFLKALSFCMMLPGPEAMQLATYAGWRLRGIPGGLVAGGLFVLPGAAIIAVLAGLYVSFGTLPSVQAAFLGIQAAVIVIVVQAILRLWSKALGGLDHKIIALAAFLALFVLDLPFPLVIALAFGYGAVRAGVPSQGQVRAPLPWRRSLAPLGLGGVLWAAPLLLAWAMGAGFLLQIGLFFSWLALATFGGAYAVLAYMTQTIVTDFGWLSTGQMIDALGLAETTPGPLILVTEFVGLLAGYANGGWGMAALAGLMTLWVTFVPCFMWIFAGAPLIDWLDSVPRIRAGLAALTAAVVGVIANLSLWFALHVWFSHVASHVIGPLRILSPDWASFDPVAAGLTGIAGALVLGLNWSIGRTLLILAGLGIAAQIITGV